MSGRGSGNYKKHAGAGGGGSERREGRGRGSNRGGSGWGNKDRNTSWGAPAPAPAPTVEEVPDSDPTPIMCPDGFQYPQMSAKVAAALRSLRNPGEVDDRTRPILEKWEEKVRIAIKMNTVIPTPPNWQAAAPRSGAGWGNAMPPAEAGSSNRIAETFLASAAKKNKPGKQHQHHSKKASSFDAPPPNLQNDPRLKDRIQQQNKTIMQRHEKLSRNQQQLELNFQTVNERLSRRDDAIQKMTQYLAQLNDKVPMLDTYSMSGGMAPEGYGSFGGVRQGMQEAWSQPEPRHNAQMMQLQKKNQP